MVVILVVNVRATSNRFASSESSLRWKYWTKIKQLWNVSSLGAYSENLKKASPVLLICFLLNYGFKRYKTSD